MTQTLSDLNTLSSPHVVHALCFLQSGVCKELMYNGEMGPYDGFECSTIYAPAGLLASVHSQSAFRASPHLA